MGARVEKSTPMPRPDTPAGRGAVSSRQNASPFELSGKDVSAGMEYTRLVLISSRPALWILQYSNTFTTLPKLCSINCRLLKPVWRPASTLGFAAASITQSTAGSDSKSLGMRISPCVSATPASRRRARFNSEPGRMRLSIPRIESPSRRSNSPSASELPTKPQIPVIRSFIQAQSGPVGSSSDSSSYISAAVHPTRGDLLENTRQAFVDVPRRIVSLHLAQVAVVANVIANAVLVHVAIAHR